MVVIESDIEPGEYFLRMHTRAPRGVYEGVLMTWNGDGTEYKHYVSIDGTGEWNTHEFPFDIKRADRFTFRFEGDTIEVAYPLLVNRKGNWHIVQVQGQS